GWSVSTLTKSQLRIRAWQTSVSTRVIFMVPCISETGTNRKRLALRRLEAEAQHIPAHQRPQRLGHRTSHPKRLHVIASVLDNRQWVGLEPVPYPLPALLVYRLCLADVEVHEGPRGDGVVEVRQPVPRLREPCPVRMIAGHERHAEL